MSGLLPTHLSYNYMYCSLPGLSCAHKNYHVYIYIFMSSLSGLSCAQKYMSYIYLYASVSFGGVHAARKTWQTPQCIRSISRHSSRAHKDLSQRLVIRRYVLVAFGMLVRPRRSIIPLSVFGQDIRFGHRLPTLQQNFSRRGTSTRCVLTSVCHCFPVPAPLSKLTRACPCYGCFVVITSALTAEAVCCDARNTHAASEQRSKPYLRQ